MRSEVVSLLAAGLLVVGCASQQKPSATVTDTPSDGASSVSKEQHEAVEKAAETTQGGGLTFSPDVLRLCPGVRSPNFGFDSAELRGEWQAALSTLATCMKTGGLKDSALLMTGYTDPRGTEDYNMALGSRRAESVRAAVVAFGVDGARVGTSSRGKAEAKGTDEASWAGDRRVDIGLRR
jgi:outer membrane protein OmpA-like peptidoglycan-associated protein